MAGPNPPIKGDVQITDIGNALPAILATIRKRESGNYTATNTRATASGAYQILDSTWRSWRSMVPEAVQYQRAKDAPPAVQDAVAGARVQQILQSYGGQLSAVPINWYYPKAWNDPTSLETAPMGNPLTVRAYAEGWLKTYKAQPNATGQSSSNSGSVNVPSGNPIIDAAGVITNRFDIPNPLDTVTGTVKAVRSTADFLQILVDPTTWVRVAKVSGGLMALVLGFAILAGNEKQLIQVARTAVTAAAA